MRIFGISMAAAATTVALVPLGAQGDNARGQAAGRARIQWQRTLRDALYLSKKKKRPLLVVVNQDDEPASETLALRRYRAPAFIALANRYVPVIASVFRHNERDYDDQGRRIPCPRFGCVTCGEHVAIEPALFERYFKNNRTAPRHIGLGSNGKELFDLFLVRDLSRIDAALDRHGPKKGRSRAITTKDRSVKGLVKSVAAIDRTALEAKFIAGDTGARRAILEAAAGSGHDHAELARLAMATGDSALRAPAVKLLSETATANALFVLLRALGTATDDGEYATLLKALARGAKTDRTCRRALTIRRALLQESQIDQAAWKQQLSGAVDKYDGEIVRDEELLKLEERIEANTKKAKTGDPGGALAFAVAHDTFRFALNRLQNRKDPTFLLHDAMAATNRATKAGLAPVRVAGMRARIQWLLRQSDVAFEHASTAVRARGKISPWPDGPRSQTAATALEIYARHHAAKLDNLPNDLEDKDYPKAALTEAHAAWSILTAHPAATAAHAEAHIQLLVALGARRASGRACRLAASRFPTSGKIHEFLRTQALWEGGAKALLAAYEKPPADANSRPTWDWFCGFAALIAAESLVRGGDGKTAPETYRACISAFDRSVLGNEAFRPSASHYVALAHGGIARLELDAKRFAAAVDAVLAGAKANPQAYEKPDGLGNQLSRTARRLRRRLEALPDLRTRLETRLRELGLLDR